jgi:hypothetical protein
MRRSRAIAVARAQEDATTLLRWLLAAAFLLLAGMASAYAEDTTSGGAQQSPPQQIVPPADPAARANGVIPAPAGIDPGIRAQRPSGAVATMPVIPPPGTPGGDPRVIPK